jgi:2-haloacid dehalogenase
MPPARSVAIFDLGGVLVDWNPRHLYRKLFAGDEAAMEAFLAEICTSEWNRCQDAGRPFAEAIAELVAVHPEKRALIEAWRDRFDEMIPGAIEGTVRVLLEVKERGVPLYALTNWSAETFAWQHRRFSFLSWFDGIVVSGAERVIKPDPRIFRILLERYAIAPESAVFVDDSPANAAAAANLGVHGIHFRTPEQLRQELVACGLLG